MRHSDKNTHPSLPIAAASGRITSPISSTNQQSWRYQRHLQFGVKQTRSHWLESPGGRADSPAKFLRAREHRRIRTGPKPVRCARLYPNSINHSSRTRATRLIARRCAAPRQESRMNGQPPKCFHRLRQKGAFQGQDLVSSRTQTKQREPCGDVDAN